MLSVHYHLEAFWASNHHIGKEFQNLSNLENLQYLNPILGGGGKFTYPSENNAIISKKMPRWG